MTDLSTATVDEVLAFADGWRAAEAGLPMDVYRSRFWLSGWSEFHLSLVGTAPANCFASRASTDGASASSRGPEPESA